MNGKRLMTKTKFIQEWNEWEKTNDKLIFFTKKIMDAKDI